MLHKDCRQGQAKLLLASALTPNSKAPCGFAAHGLSNCVDRNLLGAIVMQRMVRTWECLVEKRDVVDKRWPFLYKEMMTGNTGEPLLKKQNITSSSRASLIHPFHSSFYKYKAKWSSLT